MRKMMIAMLPVFAVACGNPEAETTALDLTNLDTSVSPAEDFYGFATGGWQKKNPLKPEYSRYGVMDLISENNQKRLNDLFKSLGQTSAMPGSVEQKISDLYKMGLDSTRLNAEGAAPLKPLLGKVLSAQDKRGLMEAVTEMHSASDYPLFSTYVAADLADSRNQILYLSQSGLGMSDRDYYLDTANTALKEGYRAFLEKVFALSGIENAAQAADDALSVEDEIAKASWSSVELRDVARSYNPMSSQELEKQYPNLDFGLYFRLSGIQPQDKLVVGQPSYFASIDSLMASTDLSKMKNYLAGQLIQGACNALSDSFYVAYFDFFQKQMAGVKEQKPRWKRAMSVPNNILSEAVGEMYVSRYFPAEDKERVKHMVDNLKTALGEHVDSLSWMSDTTKMKAHEKLNAFTVKIGYPDKWKDYSTLIINPSLSYYENIRNAAKWYVADNISRMGKPTDKDEWLMSPQTVNAYYNPTTNEICFPAAILQYPFFDMEADDAFNYGAIGVVIGHEMTHGFDDQGRQFDKDGNLKDWWAAGDADRFKERAQVMVDFFDNIEVLPGLHANGTLTLGENLADHGGLNVAYLAYKNATANAPLEDKDGFTPDQRFFLAYATLWAGNIRDEQIRVYTKSDPHSLGRWRVNGALPHIQAWYDAFNITPSDPLYLAPEKRVNVW